MNSIEQFNHHLNQEVSSKFFDWRNYRFEVTKLVNQIAEKAKNKDKVIIIGAGGLNDLNVQRLFETFNEVILSDIDLKGVLSGLEKQNINSKNYKLIRTDYTGLEQELFFEEITRLVENKVNHSKITDYIDKTFTKIHEYSFLNDYKGSSDLIIVLPIHTQLVYFQFNMLIQKLIYQGYDEMFLRTLPEYLLSKLPNVYESFNNNISSLMNVDGEVIVLSDFFEDHPESTFIKNIEKSLNNQKEIDDFYLSYVDQYGYGLGDYGYHYFLDNFVMDFTKWLIWPFNDKRSLVVKFGHFKNKRGGRL